MEQQSGIDHTALEKLAAEFNGEDFEVRVAAPQGRLPFLHIRNRRASVLTEDIYASQGSFWFSWAERIAPVECPSIAAQKIERVLRAVDSPR